MSQNDNYPESRVDFLTYHESIVKEILTDFKQLAKDPDHNGVIEPAEILQLVWRHQQD